MRIIPFPIRGEATPEDTWLVELEAALDGVGDGPGDGGWRDLREDVRALASPMSPEFERALAERLAKSRAPHRSAGRSLSRAGWMRAHRPLATALATCVAVLVAVSIAVSPWRGGGGTSTPLPTRSSPSVAASGAASKAAGSQAATSAAPAATAHATMAPSLPVAPLTSASPAAPHRVQQRAAAISLGASASEVQTVADGVARLAGSVGGFVESSHVQVQQEGSSGAELTLSIPSAKLGSALASLGALASVRSESQSVQDITDSYEAARRRLADASAERQALLRALSAASTQGQIDSLRERLAGVSRAISEDHSAVQAIARQGSTSEVEVSVVGDSHGSSEGLTVHRALHDAGDVLLVTLDVLLIGAAVLVPLALLAATLVAGLGALRRYRRERVLGGG